MTEDGMGWSKAEATYQANSRLAKVERNVANSWPGK